MCTEREQRCLTANTRHTEQQNAAMHVDTQAENLQVPIILHALKIKLSTDGKSLYLIFTQADMSAFIRQESGSK